jgi:hypothetical protein
LHVSLDKVLASTERLVAKRADSVGSKCG